MGIYALLHDSCKEPSGLFCTGAPEPPPPPQWTPGKIFVWGKHKNDNWMVLNDPMLILRHFPAESGGGPVDMVPLAGVQKNRSLYASQEKRPNLDPEK
jgi:hypothetical protein